VTVRLRWRMIAGGVTATVLLLHGRAAVTVRMG
jgi:hypothetical protein